LLLPGTSSLAGEEIRLTIMASEKPSKELSKYKDIQIYLQVRSTQIETVHLNVTKSYAEAVDLFRSGRIDGMFAGSFVAAILIRKGEAKPVVRAVLNDGATTYHALIVARKGTAPFGGVEDLKGKRVAYCALASSGEIFARSLLAPGEKPENVFTPVVTGSHLEALKALKSERADYALVKNLVWYPSKYKSLAVVGENREENPNNTLILTNAAYEKFGDELTRLFLRIEKDSSFGALEMKMALSARGFMLTGEEDFLDTFEIIEKARINPITFDFSL
jgi:ABC-type phosphate/phosphonate transport system substrate-binding protein